jgi:dTMP kinase
MQVNKGFWSHPGNNQGDPWQAAAGLPGAVPQPAVVERHYAVRVAGYSGVFIAIEGGDGAGKSTQARLLAKRLRAAGHEVVLTYEPGDTRIGQDVRRLVLDVASDGLDARAEALLYAADRAEHVASLIRPALDRGAVVITDRYIDSSITYQGVGRGLGVDQVAALSAFATGGLLPDLTVVLDVPEDVRRPRIAGLGDRLEREAAEFHETVRQAFIEQAAAEPDRYLVLDATQPPDRLADLIAERVEKVMSR